MIKTYSELVKLSTFEERLQYAYVGQGVGEETFGSRRYLNQDFYHKCPEYLSARNYVIVRDCGCDLGVEGMEILGEPIIVHHLNPITADDILNKSKYAINPEYMICVRDRTHKAIHYGGLKSLPETFKERTANDTCPWKSHT